MNWDMTNVKGKRQHQMCKSSECKKTGMKFAEKYRLNRCFIGSRKIMHIARRSRWKPGWAGDLTMLSPQTWELSVKFITTIS